MAFFSRLLTAFGRAPKPTPREAAPQVLAVAEELRKSGRVAEAVETLQRGVASTPASPGLHVALGRALTQSGRYDEAIASFDNALLLDPENLVAIRHAADAYLKKGEKVEAIKKLKLYRGLKPGDKWVGELIEKIAAELRPTQPTPELSPRPADGASPSTASEPIAAAESAPDTAPIARPAAGSSVLPSGTAPAQVEAASEAPVAAPFPLAPPAGAPSPAVTETLADLYRDQGYVSDARAAYATLAGSAPDETRRRELAEKAETAARAPLATREARLRAFLSRVPATPGSSDMATLLQDLARKEGVVSAALTDLEGLPVFSAGDVDSAELETLIAELTAFWKGVGRIDGDVGTGPLHALSLSARNGGAIVSSVSEEYALILRVAPGAPMGRIRYEAARAAWLLAPSLG